VPRRCVSLFREGLPRVTEAMNRMTPGRSTGYMGTGVYFYTDRESALRTAERRGGGNVVELPCVDGDRLLRVDDKSVEQLHDASKEMVRLAWEGFNTQRPAPELRASTLLSLRASGVRDRETLERVTETEVRHAIDRTAHCMLKAGTPFASQCSQPINNLFTALGWEGIYPTGEAGTRNDIGGVLFVEAIEGCLGRKLKSGEDVTNEKFEECFGPAKVERVKP